MIFARNGNVIYPLFRNGLCFTYSLLVILIQREKSKQIVKRERENGKRKKENYKRKEEFKERKCEKSK